MDYLKEKNNPKIDSNAKLVIEQEKLKTYTDRKPKV